MQAVAGLGNPGEEYADTRHNAGWLLLDRLAEAARVLESRTKEHVRLDKLQLGPDSLWLLRNETYMNGSGLAVADGCRSLQIDPSEVLVAYDDVDLPLGTVRIRRRGGSGGHRGMDSVIAELGTSRFPRLRLGVRGDRPWRDTAEYVLSAFEPDEKDTLDEMLERSVAAVRMILRRGLGAAMNTYNTKPEPEPESADASSDEESPREGAPASPNSQ